MRRQYEFNCQTEALQSHATEWNQPTFWAKKKPASLKKVVTRHQSIYKSSFQTPLADSLPTLTRELQQSIYRNRYGRILKMPVRFMLETHAQITTSLIKQHQWTLITFVYKMNDQQCQLTLFAEVQHPSLTIDLSTFGRWSPG